MDHLIVNVEAQHARRLWDEADAIDARAAEAREAGQIETALALSRDAEAHRDTARVAVARAQSLPDDTDPTQLEAQRYEAMTAAEVAERRKDAKRYALDDLRERRNAALAASDWTQMPDAPLTEKQRAAWAAYRQKLRDLPAGKSPELPAPPP